MNTRTFRFALPVFAIAASLAGGSLHAQFYKRTADRLHVGSISVGATGQFSTLLTQSPSNGTAFYTVGSSTYQNPTTVSNQQQYTTDSAGFLTSFGLQPFKAVGVELNYGYTHYSEKYAFNYAITPTTQTATRPNRSA